MGAIGTTASGVLRAEPGARGLECRVASRSKVYPPEWDEFIRADPGPLDTPASGILVIRDGVHEHIAIGESGHQRRE